jgi:hypothetical protein
MGDEADARESDGGEDDDARDRDAIGDATNGADFEVDDDDNAGDEPDTAAEFEFGA